MTTIAEVDVMVKADTRQYEAGIQTVKRRTAELGTFTTGKIGEMRDSLRTLRRGWSDVMLAVGMVSGVVGAAIIAAELLGSAFQRSAKKTEESMKAAKDSIDEVKKALESLKEENKTYEQQAELIKAKYAPGTAEYKNAMLDLQERMATEAYTKYGDRAALGEISAIEAQRKYLGEKPPSFEEQVMTGVPYRRAEDTYGYGPSEAYLRSATAAGGLMGMKLGQGAPGTLIGQGMPAINPELYQRAGIGTQPASIQVNVTAYIDTQQDPLKVVSDVAEGAVMGVTSSKVRTV